MPAQKAQLIATTLAVLGALLAAAPPAEGAPSDAASVDRNTVSTTAPRSPGYVVGDLIGRRVVVVAPAGYALEPASLPRPGTPNAWLALTQATAHAQSAIHSGTPTRYEIDLRYQLINAPAEVRSLTLPGLKVRFTGPQRPGINAEVAGLPVTIAPILPAHVPVSAALVRPDRSPRALSRTPALVAAGVSMALAIAIAVALLSLPLLRRRNAPFARACRLLRRAVLRAERQGGVTEGVYPSALRVVHRAFDQTAGWSLFPDRVGDFLAQWRQFADLRGRIEQFLQMSQREFFEPRSQEDSQRPHQRQSRDLRWLLDFADECRARERQTS